AEATLLIERNAPRVLDLHEGQVEPQGADEYDFYRTQYEILKSRTLAAWVIQEQDLQNNSLFAGKNAGYVTTLWSTVKGWVTKQEWASRFLPQPLDTSGENPFGAEPALIDTYVKMVEIKPVQRTRLVQIIAKTPDPVLSARLANAHAQAYIR